VDIYEQQEEKGIERGSVRTVAGVAQLLLTIPQAAAVLAVGRTTIYELIGGGELEAVHIGRSVRVPVAELHAFVARQRRTGVVR
jgi:excisionase family DNA binding protein